ncbi:hypothetical protein [uncultured Pontibacter sp.]|uniref:hypothetical protein n=1 Tax=uncultured Pontibacter sp. TaxID=453356 RepID=UPI00263A3676|nr:hypothetical protein [uncultured Pontibacter sp.]
MAYAPSKAYREGLEQYLNAVRQHDVKLWLGDYRLGKVIRMEDQQWAAKEWFPKFLPLASGIEKMARVQSEDVFSQMSSDSMKSKLDISGLPFQFSEFKYYEEAKEWLLEYSSGAFGKQNED